MALKKVEVKISDRSELSWFNLHYRRFKETLCTLLSAVPPPAKILELGSSPGYMTLALRELGYHVTGVDMGHEHFIDRIRSEGIEIKQFDLESSPLPFGSSQFDCILFTEIVEHVSPESVHKLLMETHRLLRGEGSMILSTPNVSTIDNRILKAMGKETLYKEHKKEYTMNEVEAMLAESNFTIEKKWFSRNRDVVTHCDPDRFVSRDHVFLGTLKHPYWKNFGRATTLPLKYVWPGFRSTIFVLAKKA